ncbi:MAG TPA: hypothetical protein VIZ29_08290 [Gaiellaceae bacterium]
MGRMLLARILVVLGAILAVLSLIAGYVRFQALDTQNVENTAGELIADPEIRTVVAATLVDQLYSNVDVEQVLNERLPADQKGLAGPIAGAIRLAADPAAQRILARPAVQELWVGSVGRSHQALLRVLEDETGPVTTEGGDIVLDLRPLVIQLGDRIAIVGNVSQRLGPDAGRIKIMDADQLETAQDLTQLAKTLGTWLWIVPIVLWAVALWLAEGRRRGILRMIGISAILVGLAVLVARRIAGSEVVDSLAKAESARAAASDAWDILTDQLKDGGITLIGLGVVLLVAVWISGPSRWATDSRRWMAPYIARAEIAFGAAAALLFLLVWWGPTIQTQRWQLVLAAAVVLALGVEVLRRQTAAEFPDSKTPTKGAGP